MMMQHHAAALGGATTTTHAHRVGGVRTRTPATAGALANSSRTALHRASSLSGGAEIARLRGKRAGAAAAAAAANATSASAPSRRGCVFAVVRDVGDEPSEYSQRRGDRSGRGGGGGGRGGGARAGGGFRRDGGRGGRGGGGGRGGRGGGGGGGGGETGRGGRIQGDLMSATHPNDILAIVDADGDAFDAIHTATAVHRLATHGSGGRGQTQQQQRGRDDVVLDDRFRALMHLVDRNLSKMNSHGLANVAWACARLEHNPGVDVLHDIAAGIDRELVAAAAGGRRGAAREVRPQAVSNTIWAFGQLRYKPDDATLASLCNNAVPSLRQFRAQEITNTLLGIAHMEHDPGRAFAAAAFDSVRENLQSFQGQETSNLLWACARMGHAPPADVTDALLEQCAAQNLGGMASALNLSQCLWACAKLGHAPPAGFVAAAESEIPRCANRLNPENVDCILWALATLGLHLGDDAMAALVSSAARLADRMDAEMLVKSHWALARLRHRPAAGDMQSLASAARRLVDDLPSEDRLTVMHAWGVLRCNPGDDVIRAYTSEFRSPGGGARGGGRRAGTRVDGDDDEGDEEEEEDDEDEEEEEEDAVGEAGLDGDQCAKLLCAYGRTRHLPPAEHAAALAARLVEEAEKDALHPSAAVLGLWGASLLGLTMSTAQLDVLARDATSQSVLAPRSLAKIVWALAALGYDPTGADLAALKERAAAAMPQLMAKDQEALREALARLGDRDAMAAPATPAA